MINQIANYYKRVKTIFHVTILIIILFIGLFSPLQITPVLSAAQSADLPLNLIASWSPSRIGPGSVSTLRINMENLNDYVVDQISFNFTLPENVYVMNPSINRTTCEIGVVDAAYGGREITFSQGLVNRDSSCMIEIDVSSSEVGVYSFTDNILVTYANGNNFLTIPDLTISSGFPGFLMEIFPSGVVINQTARVTYTIDNTNNSTNIYNMQFNNILPNGLVVADNPNASTTCPGGQINAVPNGSIINFTNVGSSQLLNAGTSCTVEVDVKAVAREDFIINQSELLFSSPGIGFNISAGKANTALTVDFDTAISFEKNTENYWARPGDMVDIHYRIQNLSRDEEMKNIEFHENFGVLLPGVVVTNLLTQDVCGVGSELTVTGNDTIYFSGGNLQAESSCEFIISLSIPNDADYGDYEFISSNISWEINGVRYDGLPNYLRLFIEPVPIFTKTFQADAEPIYPGDQVELIYRIENFSSIDSLSNIEFTDNLSEFLGDNSITLPNSNYCGAGSLSISYIIGGTTTLEFMNISIEPGGVCEFSINFTVPSGISSTNYVSESGNLIYTFNENNYVGSTAIDTLQIQSLPLNVSRDFLDENKIPGDIVEVVYRISNESLTGENPGSGVDVDSINFNENLTSFIDGLVISSIPQQEGICGGSSRISGTNNVLFENGSLAPGESCQFSVYLKIPDSAYPGEYGRLLITNVNFQVDNRTLSDKIDGAGLKVGGISYEMNISSSAVYPGDTIDLSFSFQNNTQYSMTNGSFSININNWISGLQPVGLPIADMCGIGSQVILSGDDEDELEVSGISLQSGEACEFLIPLSIPINAAISDYNGSSSAFSFLLNGVNLQLLPLSENISIGFPFTLTKQFLSEITAPDSTIEVRYTISNNHPSKVLTDIRFDEDFDDALSGLSIESFPSSGVCGGGSFLIENENQIYLSGGSLLPGDSCTFSLSIHIPSDIGSNTLIESATTTIRGIIDGYEFNQTDVTDSFEVYGLVIEFTGNPIDVFDPIQFNYRMRNITPNEINFDLQLDLNKIIPGLQMVSDRQDDICGVGSSVYGNTSLYAEGITIPSGEECNLIIEVKLPPVSPGHYASVEPEIRSDSPISSVYHEVSDVFVFYRTLLIIILNNSPFP
ncbi:MAG: hypothetical protein CL609_24865 [Anaerolineaceae bacterium]|nr:hypothetical protein [Anaerolineaceae bacterium]